MAERCTCTRRGLFGHALNCGTWAVAALALSSPLARAAQARTAAAPVVTAPFARIEPVADGIWAVVSTPFMPDGQRGDFTTLSNGGIIAGRDGVLAVEGFHLPAGAAWLSDQALALTGRRPTHVVATHYHYDHVGGLAGYRQGATGPEILMTARTGTLSAERNGKGRAVEGSPFARSMVPVMLPTLILPEGDAILDLGGRVVRLVARGGHTDSDVTVEVDDPRVIFGGDLVWNGIFPNFMDADPKKWAGAMAGLRADKGAIIVPGHGPVADATDIASLNGLLEVVETAARRAHAAGLPVEQAAKAFVLPESLGRWTLFSPSFYQTALQSWYRVLG